MVDMRFRWLGWVVVSMLACGDETPVTGTAEGSSSDGESSGSSSSTNVDSSSESSSSTAMTATTSTTESSSSSEGSSTGSSSESSSSESSSSESSNGDSSSEESPTSTEPMETSDVESSTTEAMCGGQPNGASCEDNCECNSDACYVVGILGGLCGECLVDADCPLGGCTIPNSIANPPEGAVCNDGSLGDGCQTNAVCQDPLVCVEIIDVPGVLTNTTCSECVVDGDCGPAQLCSPDYDILALGGDWICVDAGGVPDGFGCDFEGSGDLACASGHCAVADVMGLLELGVCGPCEVDGDCPLGTCQAPQVDLMMGLVASYCE